MTANPWRPGSRHREPAELMKPVIDPAGWYPDELRDGNAIPYDEEDPYIRKEYEDTLAKEGAATRMEEHLYQPPTGDDPWVTAGFAGQGS